MMNFLLVLVKYMGIAEKDTHVSVALFSNGAGDPYIHQIAFNDFWDFDGFLTEVSDIEYPAYPLTATVLALDRSLDDMFNTNNNGMRGNIPTTLIFVTDGACVTGGCADSEFQRLSGIFQRRSIQVIGIGAGVQVNMAEIRLLVQQGRAFEARNFDLLYDRQFILDLELCQGNYK